MVQSDLEFAPSKNSNDVLPKQSRTGNDTGQLNIDGPTGKVCDNCVASDNNGDNQCCPVPFEDEKGENGSRQQSTTELQSKNSRKIYLDDDGAVEYYNDDDIEGKNEDIIARRFCALNSSQLERLSLDQFRHWRSTGNIDVRSTKLNLCRITNFEVSALVDPLIEINPEDMKWKMRLLNDKDDMKELLKALYILDITDKFSHPLHGEESDQLQDRSVSKSSSANNDERRESIQSQNDERRNSIQSQNDERRNSIQSQSSLKNSRHGGTVHDHSTHSQSTIRKLLDYSLHRGRDDECDKIDTDEDDQTADELSCSTASSFSIPILNFRRKKDSGTSIARQFLDLTDGKDDEPPPEGKRQLIKRMTSWMGNISSSNVCEYDPEDLNSTQGESTEKKIEKDTESDAKNEDEERVTAEEIGAWDNANAILIQEVHEISGRLETILNERGLESPYWNAEEVIPLFVGLHSQIKENTDRNSRGIEEPVVDTVDIPTSVSFSLRSDDVDRSPWAIDDLTGGYDDLGMRRIQRCDRAYLKKFFYEKKADSTCSLPAALATGLEKRLPDETVEAAIDIIDELTSPIRKRRSLTTLDTINEMP
eukprot:CAMPEP_0194210182 /NCGR_PEP_ID=MMETSP0156-20130528/8063_1 /TAXON_ID=33649 /ORGANISM="Thalassionema nitzschioides, Strain L26-B" /LENGTH=592 /DNA_ID=CAMNT_0038937497 /DNA_START=24 /DNA_END=1802 /DNA_ORIENTATION=+